LIFALSITHVVFFAIQIEVFFSRFIFIFIGTFYSIRSELLHFFILLVLISLLSHGALIQILTFSFHSPTAFFLFFLAA